MVGESPLSVSPGLNSSLTPADDQTSHDVVSAACRGPKVEARSSSKYVIPARELVRITFTRTVFAQARGEIEHEFHE